MRLRGGYADLQAQLLVYYRREFSRAMEAANTLTGSPFSRQNPVRLGGRQADVAPAAVSRAHFHDSKETLIWSHLDTQSALISPRPEIEPGTFPGDSSFGVIYILHAQAQKPSDSIGAREDVGQKRRKHQSDSFQ